MAESIIADAVATGHHCLGIENKRKIDFQFQ